VLHDRVYLRSILDESIPTGGTEVDTLFTNAQLDDILSRWPSINYAAAVGWAIKAGKVADLIDIDESGSKRRLSQKHTSALRMADFYMKLAGADSASIAAAVRVVGQPVNPYARHRQPVPIENIVVQQAGGVWISYEPVGAGEMPIGADTTEEPDFAEDFHGITLDIEKNRTFRMTIEYPYDSPFTDAHMQIKALPEDVNPLWDGTVATGALAVQGDKVDVHLDPAATAGLAAESGVFEVIAVAENGDVVSVASGYVNVSVGVIA
jgi:hypothetical protein